MSENGKIRILRIKANKDKGFNFDYLLKLPRYNTKETKTLVAEMVNTGYILEDLKELDKKGIDYLTSSLPKIFEKANCIHLIALFPRLPKLYFHALSRDAILYEKENLKRVDLQFKAMIADAYEKLKEQGFGVDEKYILNGFSASGVFANRFAVLYPENVKAVISGGMSYVMLPFKELNGYKLDYPLGVNDITRFIGKKFNEKAYKQIPQLIYEGKLRGNKKDATHYNPECYIEEHSQIIHTLFGKYTCDRILNEYDVLKNNGYNNIDIRVFKDIGHKPKYDATKQFLNNILTKSND